MMEEYDDRDPFAGRLQDKIAIVTGSTSGVGAGIAHEFALEGARVMVSGRDPERGAKVIEAAVAAGANRKNLAWQPADLQDVAGCRALIERTVAVFGGLDILVNNAADVSRGNIENTPVELWDRHMAVNLRAPFVLTQASIPHLRARGGGSIINIGSVNAYAGETKLLSYSASKGGLMTFTKNVASYLTRYRIRVNQLNIGWTLTEGEEKVMRQDTGRDDWLDEAVKTRPFGRLLLPRDIALAAIYFASDESALITGTIMDMEQIPVNSRP
jgi:NAD(P)-dependent dehydrogenase (short-subunit alcohol dehydrogenase family)